MYDELASIERNFGCVAEYNRVMEEEYEYDETGRLVPRKEYEPTEEEEFKWCLDIHLYKLKKKLLTGERSELVLNLRKEWKAKEPEDHSSYKHSEWYKEMTLDIIDKLCEHYGVKATEEYNDFYRVPYKKFAISVEYTDGSLIKEKHIGNLDYETFKNIFRDLQENGWCYPSMSYGFTDDETKQPQDRHIIRSNMTLGELRIYDLKLKGVETNESIAKALEEAGYNEEKEIAEYKRKWYGN